MVKEKFSTFLFWAFQAILTGLGSVAVALLAFILLELKKNGEQLAVHNEMITQNARRITDLEASDQTQLNVMNHVVVAIEQLRARVFPRQTKEDL